MPVSADANKRSQSPRPGSSSGPRKSSNAKPVKDQSGASGASGGTQSGTSGSGNQAKSSAPQEVPHHLKRRGVATPGSMMALHRRGYILDGGNTLGSGAYAKVKVGTALKMNTQVAIKIVNKLSTPKEVVERFLPREIETMKAVDNEHIVKLHEVIETPETIFFIMELADRGDLLDFINERKYLSERLARGFFSDLVKGIDHCHSRGVVHRDLKCENLLLDSHMRLKISDFGFARKYNGNLRTFCGSFAYAAPEVILGNPYNGPLADIWSMGVILYAMVTGRLPFKDTSTSVLMADIAAGVKFSSRHTDKLRSLVTKILTFLPHDRADMAYIQGHPWMNVPLTLNFPSNSSLPASDEKQGAQIQEPPQPPKARRASQPPSPKPSQKTTAPSVHSPQPSSRSERSDSLPTTTKEDVSVPPAKGSGGGKQETLHVPGPSDSLSAPGPMRARSKSLPNDSLDIPSQERSHPLAEVCVAKDGTGSSEHSTMESPSGTGDGMIPGEGSKVVSRVLNTKNPFHSVSRYERRGSNASASDAS